MTHCTATTTWYGLSWRCSVPRHDSELKHLTELPGGGTLTWVDNPTLHETLVADWVEATGSRHLLPRELAHLRDRSARAYWRGRFGAPVETPDESFRAARIVAAGIPAPSLR